MTFGQTPENFAYLFLLFLAVIPAFFVVALVGRLLAWLLRIKSGCFAPIFTAVVVVGAVLGSSLYLDWYGTVVSGAVVEKVEQIEYREQGDWRHKFSLAVTYTLPGQSEAKATLSPPAAEFDALRAGASVPLRIVNLGNWPSLVRLADQSTLTWLPWGWIAIVLALLLVGFGLWKLSNTRAGCLPGVLFVCVLAATPLAYKWWEWRQSLDPSLTPLRVSATVTDVRRVTWLDPLPGNSTDGHEWETGFTVPEPYDIVTVRYQPQGYVDSVLGVDAVDAGRPAVEPGLPVVVLYSPTNPRQVRLIDARRLHYWLNPQGWVQDQIFNLALAFGTMLALSWLGEQAKAWWRRQVARVVMRGDGDRPKATGLRGNAP